VVGLGSAIGSVGGMLFLASSGYIVEATGSYTLLFIFCGSAYLVAVGLMHLLTANAQPVDL
jgi:ACS family hexuronate transporter-like MFS transporter